MIMGDPEEQSVLARHLNINLAVVEVRNGESQEEIISIIDVADDAESLEELMHLSTIITLSQEGMAGEEKMKKQQAKQ